MATAFIVAAWTRAERRNAPGIGGVDRVYVRTRPDIPGFAKVHFASVSRGFVCGFRQPIIISAERLELGIRGRSQPTPNEVWPDGSFMPGISKRESDAMITIMGLRNQFEQGNEQEQREAMQSFRQLFESGSSYNGAVPPPAPQGLPKYDPRYAPSDVQMQELASPRPRGCENVPIENCLVVGRRR